MAPVARLLCSHLERSARFYAEALGFEREPAPEAGAVAVRLGGVALLLCPDPSGSALPHPRGAGLALCLPVPDLEAAYAGAASHGVRVLRAPEDAPPAEGEWHFELADPDGYVLRFVQEASPGAASVAAPSARPGWSGGPFPRPGRG